MTDTKKPTLSVVKPFHSVVDASAPPDPQPNPDMARIIDNLIALNNAGKLTTLITIAGSSDGELMTGIATADSVFRVIGILETGSTLLKNHQIGAIAYE